jgi:protein-L-isoaspartate(D-aspartate) O-methyltransferase
MFGEDVLKAGPCHGPPVGVHKQLGCGDSTTSLDHWPNPAKTQQIMSFAMICDGFKMRFRFFLLSVVLLSVPLLAASLSQARRDTDIEQYTRERASMVAEQLRQRGIADARVLDVMRQVPRHLFVPESVRPLAYADRPLPIGHGQTISQPFIVAYMTDALGVARTHRVLEIGTGSGYQAAVLAHLAREVYSVEIVPELARRASALLESLGYSNVYIREGDGYAGWPEHAPFDRIIVTAAPEQVPQTLIDQLANEGRLVIPVGTSEQWLTLIEKTTAGVTQRRTIPVRFVPLTRAQ